MARPPSPGTTARPCIRWFSEKNGVAERMRVSVVRRQDVKWRVTHRFIHIHGRLHRQAPYRAQIVSKMAARLGEGGQARHNPRASAAAPRGHPTSAAIDLAARSSFPVLYRTIGVAIVSDAEFDSAQVLPKPDPGSICARVTGSGGLGPRLSFCSSPNRYRAAERGERKLRGRSMGQAAREQGKCTTSRYFQSQKWRKNTDNPPL
ncbi:hypothetical protein B0H14DRAFT_2964764, partial [Mycena olivaceomarginata]